MTAPSALARQALSGRRELVLLDDPSVLATATLLARRCRRPDPWVRAAVGTLDRFRREVAHDDLPAVLAAGRSDPAVAADSLQQLAHRHDGLTGGQLASLAFGPVLWWTAGGVDVAWRPLSDAVGHLPLPGRQTDADVRLLLLAVIGSGATEAELLGVRVRDVGRPTADGTIVADLQAEPLAVAYRDGAGPDEAPAEHLTFLSHEARDALHDRLSRRGPVGPDDPLLLPAGVVEAASQTARDTATALIGAGNDVNVAMCRATGDFFRTWGMPGARFIESSPASDSTDRTQTQEYA